MNMKSGTAWFALLVGVLYWPASLQAQNACPPTALASTGRAERALRQLTTREIPEAEELRARLGLESLTPETTIRLLKDPEDVETCHRLIEAVRSRKGRPEQETMTFYQVGDFYFVPTREPVKRNAAGRMVIREWASPILVVDSEFRVLAAFMG